MKPFVPHTLPLEKLDWSAFVALIGKANAEVARFDALLRTIPDADVLLSPLTVNEAVLSSKIEGTQATLEEVYEFEASPSEKHEKYADIQEVLNYRAAMKESVNLLNELPLSTRLIRQIHKVLLSSVRGEGKSPGDFRTGLVHIGKPGAGIETASYIPPEPQLIPDLISALEHYIHYDEKDVLVQLAIVHAQFEIIHPFWDGNGRTGRILMPLFLFYKQAISSPNFYLSEYFEMNRQSYYDALNNISQNTDWEGWIQYFLQAVIEQSARNTKKVEAILRLQNEMFDQVQDITHSQYTHKIVNFIFSNPWFDTTRFRVQSSVPKTNTTRILKLLTDHNIITLARKGSGKRPSIYIFPALLGIVK